MLGEDFSFSSLLGDTIRVRVTRGGARNLTHEQRVRARVAAREIRLGVEWHVAPVLRIHLALYGFELCPPWLLDGTSQAQPVLGRLLEPPTRCDAFVNSI